MGSAFSSHYRTPGISSGEVDGAFRKIDEQLLLDQMGWVRRLAARLVQDRNQAEDLAQETLLTAMRQPPRRAGSERSLRAWLSLVLRNLARIEARSDQRRWAREARVARPEATRSAADVVGRAYDQHLVVRTVLGLDEPYRSAILLRYFDGASVSCIADQTECSTVAVRKRLSRAHAMLRERLEREFGGDSRALSLALVTLCGGSRGLGGALGATHGGVALGAKALALACVVLSFVLLGISTWGAADIDSASVLPVPLASSGAPAAVSTGDSPRPGAPSDVSEPARTRLARGRLLRVRSATSGEGLADAEVSACTAQDAVQLQAFVEARWRFLGIETAAAVRWLNLMGEAAVPALPYRAGGLPFRVEGEEPLGRTDEEGSLRWLSPLSRQEHLVVRSVDGYPMLLPPACLAREPVDSPIDVDVPERGELTVHMIDGDGAAVEGAFARIELDFSRLAPDVPRPLMDSLSWFGPTDERGELRIPGLPVGVGLYVVPFGELACRARSTRIDPGSAEALAEVRVWRVGSTAGVIEWDDGQPGKELEVWFRGRFYARDAAVARTPTDEGGAFVLPDYSSGAGRLHIATRSAGLRQEIAFLAIEVPNARLGDLGKIVLPSLAAIEGRLFSSRGQPLYDPDWSSMSPYFQIALYKGGRLLSFTYPRDDLSFSFVAPRGDYELVVQSRGGWAIKDIYRCRVTSPTSDLRIDLDEVTGGLRAYLPEGMPDQVALSARVYFAHDPLSINRRVHDSLTYAGIPVHAGAVVLDKLPAGEYDVEFSFGPGGATFLRDIRVESGRVTDVGVLDPDGAEVSGFVFGPDEIPVAGARVLLVAPALDSLSREQPLTRETRSRADGSYKLSLVDARRWQAHAHVDDEVMSRPTLVDVVSGRRVQLDFHLEQPCFVVGRVSRSGQAAAGIEVSWSYSPASDVAMSPSESSPGVTDSEGNYRLGPLFSRGLRVHVTGVEGALSSSCELEPSPGAETVLDFEIDPDRTRLHLVLPEGQGSRLERIHATCLDAQSPGYGVRRQGVIVGEELVDLGLFPGRNLVSVTLGDSRMMHVVVDTSGIEDEETVELPPGTLELRLGAGLENGPRPTLSLLEVPSWGIRGGDRRGGLPQWRMESLPVVESGSSLRFLGIPEGAQLLLVARDEAGRTVERELLYEGPGPMRVRWP